MEKVKQNIFIL